LDPSSRFARIRQDRQRFADLTRRRKIDGASDLGSDLGSAGTFAMILGAAVASVPAFILSFVGSLASVGPTARP